MIKNKKIRNLVIFAAVVAVAVIAFFITVAVQSASNTAKVTLSVKEAQALVDEKFDALPNNVALSAKYLREHSDITVNSLDYGSEKDIVLSCSYKTLDIYSVVKDNLDDLLNIDVNDKKTGTKKNATAIQVELTQKLQALLENAPVLEGNAEIALYEMKDSSLEFYLDDKTVNTFLGGIVDATRLVNEKKSITIDGEEVDITNNSSLKRGLVQCFALKNYDSSKPDTSIPIIRTLNKFKNEFYRNFINQNNWKYLARGLGTTLSVTALSLVLGLVIGFIVAIIRCTYAKTGKLAFVDGICRIYLSIMRGTPVMIQLLIIYFVILLPLGVAKMTSAVLCFGINSGAYVSEIIRGGIMSVDNGQMEAGRSLGFNYVSTMWYIVLPQAIKAVLPALANEFIALLKETSVAFYIGVADLTMGGLKIRSITYSNFMPLIAIGLIYLVLVLGLSYLVSIFERRMNKSDRS